MLVKADGTETPTAQATRGLRPNIDLSDGGGDTERQRNRGFACDREGGKQTVSQRRQGKHVATKAGRWFYEEAPQTEWIVHLPTVNVCGGQRFKERYIDLAPDVLCNINSPEEPE